MTILNRRHYALARMCQAINRELAAPVPQRKCLDRWVNAWLQAARGAQS
jgi:hypothetical protein